MLKPLLLPVTAAALIDGQGRVLLQRCPVGKQHAGCWELPGGKVEADESPEAALVRELAEELAIDVAPADLTPMAFASHAAGERHLLLLCYLCRRWAGEPRPLAAEALAWIRPAETADLPMPPADRPLLAALARLD